MTHTIKAILKMTDMLQTLDKCSLLLFLTVLLQLGEEDFSPQGAVPRSGG